MKLRDYEQALEDKMSEFDIWVTPSLGEIRDMPQFSVNLESMLYGFDTMAILTANFKSVNNCTSSHIAKNAIDLIENKDDVDTTRILNAVYGVLLLVTGKTDNNLKCQFPLALRNIYGLESYPAQGRNKRWNTKPLPRTIQSDTVTKIIIQSNGKKEFQEKFLESYVHLIISDKQYTKQLWSLGMSYCAQKEVGTERDFLSPIVVFQSRGSITATQGHIPENILRQYMSEWGLVGGSDYNTQDVEIGEIIGDIEVNPQIKKRKYDFILPYHSRNRGSKVFIQSQFYAGDSGSVSHKVVDQTDSSREVTLKKYPKAVFVEYLDGAGYFSSLNGDLRKMLAKPTTKNFIQINTAPLKLRRELQIIDFLTPLEIEHAIIMTDGKKDAVETLLLNDGYSKEEIYIAIKNAVSENIITDGNKLHINDARKSIIRKYCLLDTIANFGAPIPTDKTKGFLIVPGYSVNWGMPQAEVIKQAISIAPSLEKLWTGVTDAFEDIQWLLEKGFIKAR